MNIPTPPASVPHRVSNAINQGADLLFALIESEKLKLTANLGAEYATYRTNAQVEYAAVLAQLEEIKQKLDAARTELSDARRAHQEEKGAMQAEADRQKKKLEACLDFVLRLSRGDDGNMAAMFDESDHRDVQTRIQENIRTQINTFILDMNDPQASSVKLSRPIQTMHEEGGDYSLSASPLKRRAPPADADADTQPTKQRRFDPSSGPS